MADEGREMVTDEMLERAQAAARTEAVKRDGGYDLHPVPDWAISVVIEAVAPLIATQARREALEEARVAKGVWLELERDRIGDADIECALCELAAARIRALASQPPAPPSDGWQPMETAPRDGTTLLLAKIVGHPDHKTALWWACTGHWSEKWKNWNDGYEPSGLAGPTHWLPISAHGVGVGLRPLPAQPKEPTPC